MKIQIFKSKLYLELITVVALDAIFFGITDPNKVNSLWLIAGFVLLGLSLYVVIKIVLVFLVKLGLKIKNRRKLAIFSAGLICFLLALQSIGQLSLKDVLIIVPITVLLYVYLAFIRPKTLV